MWSSLFDLFLIFHEASAKKVRKKSSMAFQCQDWDTKFSYQIDYFWIFMKLQQKTWRNIYLHFNAKTVIQHFLPTLILFLTFHEDSVKESGRNLLLESSFLGGRRMGRPTRSSRSFRHKGHRSIGRSFLEFFGTLYSLT